MAHVNYIPVNEGYMGGGLTWQYYLSPIDSRYNDVVVTPDVFANNQSGNLEILRKWFVTDAQGNAQLWYEVRNNSSNDSYFNINLVNITP